jgi:hypothetical protein
LGKREIAKLIYRDAHPIDRCDCDLPESLFAPGAMLRYGLFDGTASEQVRAAPAFF